MCCFNHRIAIVTFRVLACASLASLAPLFAQEPSEETRQGLKLTLDSLPDAVRPGELVSVPITLQNLQPKPVLLVVNQGDVGGHYAAKTLTHQLVDVVSGEVLWQSNKNQDGCPVGEGFKESHFHTIAGGKTYRGVVHVKWPKFQRYVPMDLPSDMYRLEITYARPQAMSPGQIDDEKAQKLWKDADALKSNTATASLRIFEWDAAATRKLGERIAHGEVAAMRAAQLAKLEDVYPAVEKAMFSMDELPAGSHGDFRTYAVAFMEDVPFALSGPALLRVLQSDDMGYRLKHHAIYALASFPPDVVGPWLVEEFGKNDDRYLRDKLLGVLAKCKYSTDDEAIIGYMLKEVRDVDRGRFSITGSYVLSACEAIGGKNSRPVVLAIRDRLSDVQNDDQYDRMLKTINTLLQEP